MNNGYFLSHLFQLSNRGGANGKTRPNSIDLSFILWYHVLTKQEVVDVRVKEFHNSFMPWNGMVKNMKSKGITPIYLITDHTSFYERYGWEFLCMVQGDNDPDMTRMYIHR